MTKRDSASRGEAGALSALALIRWRERELTFPPRVRRMTPDAFDMIEAWPRMLMAARAALKDPS